VVERRLPMAILDAEYQFDRHKLVFFFEADRLVIYISYGSSHSIVS
jgi:cell fate regulator YaaT (PSP1 superfamily)